MNEKKKTIKTYLIVRAVVAIFCVFLLITGYNANKMTVIYWIRENLYGDSNPVQSMTNITLLRDGYIDKTVYKYNPLFVCYQIVQYTDDLYAAQIRYIDNEGYIHEFTMNSQEVDAPSMEELQNPSYIRSACEYDARLNEPDKKLDDIQTIANSYNKAKTIKDRNTFEHVILTDSTSIEETSKYQYVSTTFYGYSYISDTEFVITKYYEIINGSASYIKDETAREIYQSLEEIKY